MRRDRGRWFAALSVTVLLTAGCSATSTDEPATRSPADPAAAAPDPTSEPWPTTRPTEAGFDPHRLAGLAREAKREASTCFAVVRDGRLVRDWDWHDTEPDDPREVFSVTKSVASALVGIAVKDGLLALDDPASRWITEWRGTASASVTVRDLLTNTSGRFWSAASDYQDLIGSEDRTGYAIRLEQQHEPGTAWAYNNAAIQTLDRVISEATGGSTADFAEERLFGPLGMADSRLTTDASGRSTNLFFGMQTTCLDLARFGRLYLDGGAVDGEQVLPRWYVEASVGRSGTELNAAYGFLWWLNRPGVLRGPADPVDAAGQPLTVRTGQIAPGAPGDLFSAQGLFGQTLLVDPGSRTIVVRLGLMPDGQAGFTTADAARVVTEALRPG
ncbi:serine hydrolase domain-containing protein [Nocardioides sp.]|uniref:serine hydrolase domain-containing protein n=1 Tax=Nocardioides sp. TaxID=35761 RepID=UPI002ED529D3